MGICRIRANTGAEFTTDRWDLEAHLPGVSTGLKHSAQDEKRLTFSLTSSDFTNQGVLKSRGWSLTIQKVNKNFTQVLTLKAAQNWCRLKQKAVSSVYWICKQRFGQWLQMLLLKGELVGEKFLQIKSQWFTSWMSTDAWLLGCYDGLLDDKFPKRCFRVGRGIFRIFVPKSLTLNLQIKMYSLFFPVMLNVTTESICWTVNSIKTQHEILNRKRTLAW